MLRLGLVVCLASRGMWRGCEGCWCLRDIRSHFNAHAVTKLPWPCRDKCRLASHGNNRLHVSLCPSRYLQLSSAASPCIGLSNCSAEPFSSLAFAPPAIQPEKP